jgi:YesN/AraC family two-component response regulator
LPIKQSIFSIETLDEIFDVLLDQLKAICSEREKNTVSAKHLVITENVKAIIEKEYHDSSLCLSAIAHRLKMSSGYLGKIFKDCCGISVNEYINDVRLAKAAEWLRKSSLTVSEVLLKVGIENETYFYSLFKKRYGVTPKEYVLNSKLQSKH